MHVENNIPEDGMLCINIDGDMASRTWVVTTAWRVRVLFGHGCRYPAGPLGDAKWPQRGGTRAAPITSQYATPWSLVRRESIETSLLCWVGRLSKPTSNKLTVTMQFTGHLTYT